MSPLERFWAKVDKTPGQGPRGQCWGWLGVLNARTGRAYFKVGQKNHIAARWIWEQTHGPLPRGVCVLHRCDNNACVRIDLCLWTGSQRENISDRDGKGRNRLAATTCARGHSLLDGANVRRGGPDGKWRTCRACARLAQERYRTRLEAEAW